MSHLMNPVCAASPPSPLPPPLPPPSAPPPIAPPPAPATGRPFSVSSVVNYADGRQQVGLEGAASLLEPPPPPQLPPGRYFVTRHVTSVPFDEDAPPPPLLPPGVSHRDVFPKLDPAPPGSPTGCSRPRGNSGPSLPFRIPFLPPPPPPPLPPPPPAPPSQAPPAPKKAPELERIVTGGSQRLAAGDCVLSHLLAPSSPPPPRLCPFTAPASSQRGSNGLEGPDGAARAPPFPRRRTTLPERCVLADGRLQSLNGLPLADQKSRKLLQSTGKGGGATRQTPNATQSQQNPRKDDFVVWQLQADEQPKPTFLRFESPPSRLPASDICPRRAPSLSRAACASPPPARSLNVYGAVAGAHPLPPADATAPGACPLRVVALGPHRASSSTCACSVNRSCSDTRLPPRGVASDPARCPAVANPFVIHGSSRPDILPVERAGGGKDATDGGNAADAGAGACPSRCSRSRSAHLVGCSPATGALARPSCAGDARPAATDLAPRARRPSRSTSATALQAPRAPRNPPAPPAPPATTAHRRSASTADFITRCCVCTPCNVSESPVNYLRYINNKPRSIPPRESRTRAGRRHAEAFGCELVGYPGTCGAPDTRSLPSRPSAPAALVPSTVSVPCLPRGDAAAKACEPADGRPFRMCGAWRIAPPSPSSVARTLPHAQHVRAPPPATPRLGKESRLTPIWRLARKRRASSPSGAQSLRSKSTSSSSSPTIYPSGGRAPAPSLSRQPSLQSGENIIRPVRKPSPVQTVPPQEEVSSAKKTPSSPLPASWYNEKLERPPMQTLYFLGGKTPVFPAQKRLSPFCRNTVSEVEQTTANIAKTANNAKMANNTINTNNSISTSNATTTNIRPDSPPYPVSKPQFPLADSSARANFFLSGETLMRPEGYARLQQPSRGSSYTPASPPGRCLNDAASGKSTCPHAAFFNAIRSSLTRGAPGGKLRLPTPPPPASRAPPLPGPRRALSPPLDAANTAFMRQLLLSRRFGKSPLPVTPPANGSTVERSFSPSRPPAPPQHAASPAGRPSPAPRSQAPHAAKKGAGYNSPVNPQTPPKRAADESPTRGAGRGAPRRATKSPSPPPASCPSAALPPASQSRTPPQTARNTALPPRPTLLRRRTTLPLATLKPSDASPALSPTPPRRLSPLPSPKAAAAVAAAVAAAAAPAAGRTRAQPSPPPPAQPKRDARPPGATRGRSATVPRAERDSPPAGRHSVSPALLPRRRQLQQQQTAAKKTSKDGATQTKLVLPSLLDYPRTLSPPCLPPPAVAHSAMRPPPAARARRAEAPAGGAGGGEQLSATRISIKMKQFEGAQRTATLDYHLTSLLSPPRLPPAAAHVAMGWRAAPTRAPLSSSLTPLAPLRHPPATRQTAPPAPPATTNTTTATGKAAAAAPNPKQPVPPPSPATKMALTPSLTPPLPPPPQPGARGSGSGEASASAVQPSQNTAPSEAGAVTGAGAEAERVECVTRPPKPPPLPPRGPPLLPALDLSPLALCQNYVARSCSSPCMAFRDLPQLRCSLSMPVHMQWFPAQDFCYPFHFWK